MNTGPCPICGRRLRWENGADEILTGARTNGRPHGNGKPAEPAVNSDRLDRLMNWLVGAVLILGVFGLTFLQWHPPL